MFTFRAFEGRQTARPDAKTHWISIARDSDEFGTVMTLSDRRLLGPTDGADAFNDPLAPPAERRRRAGVSEFGFDSPSACVACGGALSHCSAPNCPERAAAMSSGTKT